MSEKQRMVKQQENDKSLFGCDALVV